MRSSKYLFIFCALLLLVSSVQVVSAEGGYAYITQWGSFGSGDGQFSYPYGIAVDSAGDVYVVDRDNNRIQKFTSIGTFLTKWGSIGSGDGQFNYPIGIAVDSARNVYVADPGNDRIQKFNATGGFITKWGSEGSGDGQFNVPTGIAVDSAGNVFVVDTGNSRIQEFTSTGTFITKWGSYGSGDGQFLSPFGIAVDSAGDVYVIDTYNNRVQKFNANGTFITKWGSEGAGDGQFDYPRGVAVDSAGNVYVTDWNNNRVQKFTSTGTFLTKWGSEGSGDGQFDHPVGIAVDSAGNVYVAEFYNYRVQKFAQARSPVVNFTANVTAGPVPLAVQFNDTSAGSPTSWSWNFGDLSAVNTTRNATHVYTQPGIYTVNLTATNSDGSNSTSKAGYITVTSQAPPSPTPTLAPRPSPSITAGFYAFGHVGQAPYPVRFLDQSTGSPTAWKWDFGDGTTSTEQNPTHIFTQTGVYNVALIATNDQGSDTAIQYRCIIVNAVPVANFTANQTAGRTPFTVQFTDESSDANGYQWQFGDGTTSTGQNPVHTYSSPGTYTVTLTISVPDYGSVFTQKPGYITVTDPSTIGFSANVTAGLSPLAVQFNESTTGSVQYFYWHFGDGSTSFDRNPVHVYNTAGKYTVSLFAAGSSGTQVKTADKYINVTTPVTPTVTPTPTSTQTIPLPVANFTVATSDPGSLGILIADTSENATSVRYDLGDGTTTAIRNFRYTYWQAGTYTIEQTATNAAGSSHKTLSVTVPAVEPTTTFPPIGGDQGWYTVHCNVDGATVLFDQTPMGTTAGGILKVRVYTTGTPFQTYTVSKDGYTTFQGTITAHPGKDQNVDLTAQLTPIAGPAYNGPHTIPGLLQAEDYNLGGEGVAYHDTTRGNEGGTYRQDDVDIEVLDTDHSPNVGWIRSGEWLTYTVNVSTAGTYDAGFRVASSHAGSSVQVYVDDGTTPVATVNVPNTGYWPVFRTVPVQVTLPTGQHRLKLAFPTDFVNINWISFALRG